MLADLARQLFGVDYVSAGFTKVAIKSRVVRVDSDYQGVSFLPTIATTSMLLEFVSSKIDERLVEAPQ